MGPLEQHYDLIEHLRALHNEVHTSNVWLSEILFILKTTLGEIRVQRRKKMPKKDKVEKTMHEFKEGKLHSGSKTGPKVKSRKQAIAIALNQKRKGK